MRGAVPSEPLMGFLLGNERWGQLTSILISLEQERARAFERCLMDGGKRRRSPRLGRDERAGKSPCLWE